MAQAKKKQSTKTTKQPAARGQARKKACTRTCKKQQGISNSERMHIYIITAMAMITVILLCANIAIMMV